MYTLAKIRTLSTIIKNETRRFFNTGARIDEVIQAIIDHIDYLGQEGVGSLWEIGDGNILQPKKYRTFTIKKANEVNVAGGSTDKFLNEQGDFTTIQTSTIGVTYEDLLGLINNNELIPSSSYRITNYTTTTSQTDTVSAGHDFDIIVTALSTNELSETASCVRKEGDIYFTNAKLEAWGIKYSINNDVNRFAWADTVNGKGVIYYMKDEWGNECPYDFKNIQFKKSDVFLYTFGGTTDDSLAGGCRQNIMLAYMSSSVITLNFNTFGVNCYYNTFGNSCIFNTFGDNCNNNTFGNNCYYNTFGDNLSSNTFGNSCYYNTFGDYCSSNTFGNNCYYNTFGNYCQSNNFYDGTSGTTKKNYIRYIILEDGCRWNNFYSELTTSSASYLQRIRIKGLQHTTATDIQIGLFATNTNYEWLICYTSGGVLKQYSPNEEINNLLPLIYAGL